VGELTVAEIAEIADSNHNFPHATQIKLPIVLSQFGRIAVEYSLEFVMQIKRQSVL
jgi:hypothetical protein